ncbi:MAG: hypothetical protein QNI89_16495 [Desulfobacterales bacterium]|nr:hypothetical protein [Desulfobacterales bacterium]MDJ0854366.1 hypothetical protein [Desulfobacterales bacterium]MDJ0888907.1 hypothetical protein [Desulfobacterales bacterium]MDJ0990916.1 hypothetical protein [Desulfobacterales bacterium]
MAMDATKLSESRRPFDAQTHMIPANPAAFSFGPPIRAGGSRRGLFPASALVDAMFIAPEPLAADDKNVIRKRKALVRVIDAMAVL